MAPHIDDGIFAVEDNTTNITLMITRPPIWSKISLRSGHWPVKKGGGGFRCVSLSARSRCKHFFGVKLFWSLKLWNRIPRKPRDRLVPNFSDIQFIVWIKLLCNLWHICLLILEIYGLNFVYFKPQKHVTFSGTGEVQCN